MKATRMCDMWDLPWHTVIELDHRYQTQNVTQVYGPDPDLGAGAADHMSRCALSLNVKLLGMKFPFTSSIHLVA